MGYWTQFLFWMGVAFAPLVVNALACRLAGARHSDALGLSGMLVTFWVICNFMINTPPGQPENMLALTFLDLAGLGIVLASWWTERANYKLVLAATFLAQLVAHATFWWGYDRYWGGWSQAERDGARLMYKGALNFWFLISAFSISWPGGSRLALRIVDLLSHPRHHGHYPDAGPRGS